MVIDYMACKEKIGRYSYYGGLKIDHKTKESVSPDGDRKFLTKEELKEMKRREKLIECELE